MPERNGIKESRWVTDTNQNLVAVVDVLALDSQTMESLAGLIMDKVAEVGTERKVGIVVNLERAAFPDRQESTKIVSFLASDSGKAYLDACHVSALIGLDPFKSFLVKTISAVYRQHTIVPIQRSDNREHDIAHALTNVSSRLAVINNF